MYNRKSVRLHRRNRGFTLVEILIVVIILGILAAIVIPQFSNASTDARKSSLTTQLQSLQQQIAYYKLQHVNANPPLSGTDWSALTEYTDAQGNVSATQDATHCYGPYFPTPPANPLAAAANATTIATDPTSGTAGWIYDVSTGKIYATGTVSTNYFNPADGTDTSTPPY